MSTPRSLLPLITLILFSSIASLLAADTFERKPIRIMPVGDSITEGGKSFSTYRVLLWEKLTAAGYAFEFIGSKKSDSKQGPLAHEGYGGKNAEFLSVTAVTYFKTHPADIVLIHAGHNYAADDRPVGKIIAATEKMITSFRADNPNVTILLAQVITSGKLPKYSYIPELNDAIAKLAERMNTAAQRIILVNQADGFDWNKDTIADHVHPNESGAEKMAAKWFDALSKIMPKSK